MKVLLVSDLIIPTFNIGIIRPFLELKKQGDVLLRMEKPASVSSKDIDWCDVAIFCRSQDIASFNVFKRLKSREKFVIYDIDDNFFELPLDSELSYYHRKSEHIYTLEYFLKYSDIVSVYSTSLQKKALEYNENVFLLKCYFDNAIIQDSFPEKKNNIRIAYATGRSPDAETEKPLEEALVDVLSKYGNDVELHFWRSPFESLKNHSSVVQHSATPNYESFIRDFYKLGFDIGLAPLADGVFYNSKTNNKYREYSGCGVAGIYSNVELYQSCIVNGENGVLTNNTKKSWFHAIETLILSPELRDKLSTKAKIDVDEHYSFKNAVSQWRYILLELRSKNIPRALHGSMNKQKNLLYFHMGSHDADLSNGTYQLVQNIHRNFRYLFPNIREEKRRERILARYYGRIVCWYICNGKSDQKVISELSEKFKYLIVDLNKFERTDCANENIYYLYQDDSKTETTIDDSSIIMPSQLSTMSRGKNTSAYIMFHCYERFNIGEVIGVREVFKSLFWTIHLLRLINKFSSLTKLNYNKYCTNLKMKIKSVILYNYLKYKIRL